MYAELYAAWRWELENSELGSLPSDFYARISDYLRKIKEEARMLDKKLVKSILLEHELRNTRRMIQELVSLRYEKLMKIVVAGQKAPVEALAAEEMQVAIGITPFTDAYHQFTAALLQGQLSRIDTAKPNKRVTLRFTKEIPAIIGADMKTYGPFMSEDVASVPVENAKILTKQGFAEIVEIPQDT